MGWLFKSGSTRRDLIEERTQSWERQSGDMLVKSTCLAHCYRGNVFSGVLWSVWERTFTKDDAEVQPTERWIQCDLLQYQRDYGWGYKDMEESMGPYYYSCPMKYLDMVPIDTYGGNPEWRVEVMQHHERRRDKRKARAIIV
jgi:hypothetical protein